MSAPMINVYTPGFKSVLKLRHQSIAHLPAVNPAFYVLCTKYDASIPASSCRMGNGCKFVHADISGAREQVVHVNYAWRSLDDVTYARLPEGGELRVAPPNGRVAVDVMDSSFVLKTRALDGATKLTHCAHYYFNRTCNMGPDCHFIHAIFIDPTAMPGQRAPVPSQLGEGRELQLSKKQRESGEQPKATRRTSGMKRVDSVMAPSTVSASSDSASLAMSSMDMSSCSRSSGVSTPRGTEGTTSPSPNRAAYRHNPYSLVSCHA